MNYKHAIKKAKKSGCRFKVSAIALNTKGDTLGVCANVPRLECQGGSLHAEIVAVMRFPSVATVIVCRVNTNGKLLPINICKNCRKFLARQRVKGYVINPKTEVLEREV